MTLMPEVGPTAGKAHVVDLVPVKRLRRSVTLAESKADRRFREFPLTRIPRLSVMPVSDDEWEAILGIGRLTPPSAS